MYGSLQGLTQSALVVSFGRTDRMNEIAASILDQLLDGIAHGASRIGEDFSTVQNNLRILAKNVSAPAPFLLG
jgi:hypothetical protein